MKTYSAYLFDMDGTLVNSEKFKGMALSKTCMKFGGQADINTYKAVMGESWTIVTNHFFKAAQIAPGLNEFNSEFQKIYQKLLSDNLSLNPGAKDLLIKLKARNKRTAIVSSGATWMVNQILSQLELSNFFNLVITREHVKKHKPDPEAFILALKHFSLSNSGVLIFEDSNAGLMAANRAGCDAIAFQHQFNINNDLSLAVQTISDFNEVRL